MTDPVIVHEPAEDWALPEDHDIYDHITVLIILLLFGLLYQCDRDAWRHHPCPDGAHVEPPS